MRYHFKNEFQEAMSMAGAAAGRAGLEAFKIKIQKINAR